MTDRERLIELYENSLPKSIEVWQRKYTEEAVDHLLANGVIVPPCKVGDTVYRFEMSRHTKRILIKETKVERIAICFDKVQVFCKGYAHSPANFGKTVFLTKEEAEQALKEITKGK